MEKYEETIEKIRKFNDERDWDQFHTPKDVAISISLEANELLELFQWKNEEEIKQKLEEDSEYKTAMKDEIADIANYLFVLCDKIGVDLLESVNSKLEKVKIKYPVERCRGRADKYTVYMDQKNRFDEK